MYRNDETSQNRNCIEMNGTEGVCMITKIKIFYNGSRKIFYTTLLYIYIYMGVKPHLTNNSCS